MTSWIACAFLGLALAAAGPALAADQAVPNWPMSQSRTITDNAEAAEGFSTLVSAMTQTDIARLLQEPGPFTVFAPADAAFAKLSPQRMQTLMHPDNRSELARLLGAHVVRGKMSSPILTAMARASAHGGYRMYTVSGDFLLLRPRDGKLWLRDEHGSVGLITMTDISQSNGVIHVVDTVLVPF
ncbi:fasciclin domain-containing protein [Chachezhania antarctica]|uniref:fasciclin domain-containing protein n=1 Tax=Chachezhania antarctica TaxID=2340860 RepID=UPI000EAD26D4|nr:fasciclin domain-containing protein [Chachezhania antarctica]|tara:strand:+ start:644 stop:1195 length:552 start_codon:yes stop_codon:yes gene_type:complete